MAHQAVKPYSFLMYLLSVLAGLFLGLVFANITEAGKGQMLAGGAIVLGYGVVGACIGLCLALYIAFIAKRPIIIKLNGLLAIIIVASLVFISMSYQKRQREKLENESQEIEQSKNNLQAELLTHSPTTIPANFDPESRETEMGLGMFTPNFYENKTLYFYGNLTFGKSAQEHIASDSITFKQNKYGNFEITTAPPWLVPNHMKLDYGMLSFKVISVGRDFTEIVVNATNNQTAFVDRYSGKIQYWPEFLLGIHSVEFINPSDHQVYVRPFD